MIGAVGGELLRNVGFGACDSLKDELASLATDVDSRLARPVERITIGGRDWDLHAQGLVKKDP